MFNEYETISGGMSVEQAIESEVSGDFKTALIAIGELSRLSARRSLVYVLITLSIQVAS